MHSTRRTACFRGSLVVESLAMNEFIKRTKCVGPNNESGTIVPHLETSNKQLHKEDSYFIKELEFPGCFEEGWSTHSAQVSIKATKFTMNEIACWILMLRCIEVMFFVSADKRMVLMTPSGTEFQIRGLKERIRHAKTTVCAVC
jgi:hypothetical protein